MTSDTASNPHRPAVLVTGGSGGLGAFLVRRFAADGHPVYFTYVSHEEAAESLASELRGAGKQVVALRVDVREESQLHAAVATMEANGHPPGILVNNAGVSFNGMSWKLDAAQWRATLEVNTTGAFLATKAVLPGMRERGFGRILSMSSVVGERGIAGTVAYAASKSALSGFTRAVAREVAARGVTVNALVLGYFDAGMGRQLPDEARERIVATIPAQRFGDPGKLAAIVAFLASPDCDYVTGQEIVVDGGFLG